MDDSAIVPLVSLIQGGGGLCLLCNVHVKRMHVYAYVSRMLVRRAGGLLSSRSILHWGGGGPQATKMLVHPKSASIFWLLSEFQFSSEDKFSVLVGGPVGQTPRKARNPPPPVLLSNPHASNR